MKTTSEQQREELKQRVMIELLLIQPIEKIIAGLEAKEYGNNDIDYIEKKLGDFIDIAAKALNVTGRVSHESFTVMNEYARAKYIEYFSKLLMFFRDVKKAIEVDNN
jgi:hypothetical protein